MKKITQAIIVFIISAILCVSCIQIYDRCTFHKYVKKAASEYIDSISKKQLVVLQDSSSYANDSIGKPIALTNNKDERIFLYNNVFNNSSELDSRLHMKEILEILSKSDGILSANGITFLVTLVVALLVTLLLYRMDTEQRLRENFENKIESKMESKIESIIEELKEGAIKDLKEETNSIIIHSAIFDRILTSVSIIYNLGLMIGNGTMGLSSAKTKKTMNINTSKKVGELCSRLSLICDETKNRLKDKKRKLDFITKDEKDILDTYLTDTLGELERSLDRAKQVEIEPLCNIIIRKIDIVEEIKEILNRVEMQEDVSNSC